MDTQKKLMRATGTETSSNNDLPSYVVSPFWLQQREDSVHMMMGEHLVAAIGDSGVTLSPLVDDEQYEEVMRYVDMFRNHMRETENQHKENLRNELRRTFSLVPQNEFSDHAGMSFDDAWLTSSAISAILPGSRAVMREKGISIIMSVQRVDETLWSVEEGERGNAVFSDGHVSEKDALVFTRHMLEAAQAHVNRTKAISRGLSTTNEVTPSSVIDLMKESWRDRNQLDWVCFDGKEKLSLRHSGVPGVMSLSVNDVLVGVIRPICDVIGPCITVEMSYHGLDADLILGLSSKLLVNYHQHDNRDENMKSEDFKELLSACLLAG